ncbi:unnamed protein product [Mycena citricolor]|uniref:Uncharacterized protein n=1 Tax=Mycena citricolor TaxID=2018698 RepID=A0AAD2HWV4_9AGAR|nr:unnamed protein product [Mycena citricolor]
MPHTKHPHMNALASTSRSSSDMGAMLLDVVVKANPQALLPTPFTNNNPIRVIQLVEIAAPPRSLVPPTTDSSVYSSEDSDDDEDEEDSVDEESYCSSSPGDEEDAEAMEEERQEELTMQTRILAWRARFEKDDTRSSSSGRSTGGRLKRPASSVCSSSSSVPSKRSRTSMSPSVSVSVSPAASAVNACTPSAASPSSSRFLAPPSPLARRHSSPRQAKPSPLAFSLTAHVVNSPPGSPAAGHVHQRAQSLVGSETTCPACDRWFSSREAFELHASLRMDNYGAEACGAAVAYAQEPAAMDTSSPLPA